jgi:hypothetical protein
MKIVINRCFGGFSISKEAVEYMAINGHEQAKSVLLTEKSLERDGSAGYSWPYFQNQFDRQDNILIQAVETLKEKANGPNSKLKVVEIEISYDIIDRDGMETVQIYGI